MDSNSGLQRDSYLAFTCWNLTSDCVLSPDSLWACIGHTNSKSWTGAVFVSDTGTALLAILQLRIWCDLSETLVQNSCHRWTLIKGWQLDLICGHPSKDVRLGKTRLPILSPWRLGLFTSLDADWQTIDQQTVWPTAWKCFLVDWLADLLVSCLTSPLLTMLKIV